MKSFDFDHVKEVRIEGLADFELVVDAHQDGGPPSSVEISGKAADSVSVQEKGGVITVQGQDGAPRKPSRSVSMTGTFVTGNVPIPVASVPKEPLIIRYGGFREAPVTINVSLPPGQQVVLRGPFNTVTTAAPSSRSERVPRKVRAEVISDKLREKAQLLLETAKADRSDGSLAGAIRAHAREEEARRLLDGDSGEEK